MENRYSITHPIAAEIIIEGEGKDIAEFCLQGLKLAVREQKMSPETAKENYLNWFGEEVEF